MLQCNMAVVGLPNRASLADDGLSIPPAEGVPSIIAAIR